MTLNSRSTLCLLVVLLFTAGVGHLAAQQPAVNVTVRTAGDLTLPDSLRQHIARIAETATRDVAAILPGTPTTWTLEIGAGTMVIPETGEVGFASAPTRITWTVNPAVPGGVAAIVDARLRKVLFHELHHIARGWTREGGAPVTSIMDAVIAEGMATVFAREHAGDVAPWGEAPAAVAEWARELDALPASALGAYGQWMFQHPDGRRWIGYRTGTWLVDEANRRSCGSSVTLVRAATADVVRCAMDRPASSTTRP